MATTYSGIHESAPVLKETRTFTAGSAYQGVKYDVHVFAKTNLTVLRTPPYLPGDECTCPKSGVGKSSAAQKETLTFSAKSADERGGLMHIDHTHIIHDVKK